MTDIDPGYGRGDVRIRDMVIDPTNWQVAYAVDETHVFRTVNGGQDWEDFTGFPFITSPLKQISAAEAARPLALPDVLVCQR